MGSQWAKGAQFQKKGQQCPSASHNPRGEQHRGVVKRAEGGAEGRDALEGVEVPSAQPLSP